MHCRIVVDRTCVERGEVGRERASADGARQQETAHASQAVKKRAAGALSHAATLVLLDVLMTFRYRYRYRYWLIYNEIAGRSIKNNMLWTLKLKRNILE